MLDGATRSRLHSAEERAFFEPHLPIVLQTDDAKTPGLGFSVLQRHWDDWRLVQCWSHFLVIAESRYAVVDLELTVVLWAYRNCHVYLAGLPHFDVVVDHRPLVTILNHKQLNAIDSPPLYSGCERSCCTASPIPISWENGSAHVIPDALSRAPTNDLVAEDVVGEDDPLHACVISALRAADQREKDATLSPLIDPALERVRSAEERDQEYRTLLRELLHSFPKHRHQVHPAVRAYWGI